MPTNGIQKNACHKCPEYSRCRDDSISWLFFLFGIVATVAVRAVTVLAHVHPLYGQISWYIGVAGFLIFFLYKFRIEHDRSRLIRQRRLQEKIERGEELAAEDYRLLHGILCALSSNKDRINYFFIFVSSAVALVLAVYFDFFRK